MTGKSLENECPMRECDIVRTEKKQKKPKKVETANIEENLKQLPPPPEEHAHELKMEKHLKHMLEEQEKKKTKKSPS